MRVINVRGPCGAGKSHLVHRVIDERNMEPVLREGRRQPLGYFDTTLFVPGHYELHMGGIDTFKTTHEPYDLIAHYLKNGGGRNVLYEGKTFAADVPYVESLMDFCDDHRIDVEFHAVLLDVTVEEAVKGVRTRPSATEIREENVARTWRKGLRELELLKRIGVTTYKLKRREALLKVKELIR